jgi:putative exosortase-associated protein (TIGR04073 family)
MKKLLTSILAISFLSTGTVAVADIHEPPAAKWTMTRKLSRAIGNIFYAPMEIVESYNNVLDSEGQIAATTYGTLHGVERGLVRLSYGLIELVTFPVPSYKGSYRPAMKDGRIYPKSGFEEFAPRLGFASETHRYVSVKG